MDDFDKRVKEFEHEVLSRLEETIADLKVMRERTVVRNTLDSPTMYVKVTSESPRGAMKGESKTAGEWADLINTDKETFEYYYFEWGFDREGVEEDPDRIRDSSISSVPHRVGRQRYLFERINDMQWRMRDLASYVQQSHGKRGDTDKETKRAIADSIPAMDKDFDKAIEELNALREEVRYVLEFNSKGV